MELIIYYLKKMWKMLWQNKWLKTMMVKWSHLLICVDFLVSESSPFVHLLWHLWLMLCTMGLLLLLILLVSISMSAILLYKLQNYVLLYLLSFLFRIFQEKLGEWSSFVSALPVPWYSTLYRNQKMKDSASKLSLKLLLFSYSEAQ